MTLKKPNLSLAKHYLVYLSTSTINKVLPLLIIPIIISKIDPEEYGIWSLFKIFFKMAIIFMGMQLPLNVIKNFSQEKKKEFAALVGNVFLALCFNFIITIAIIFCCSIFIREYSKINTFYFIFLPLLVFFEITILVYTRILQRQRQSEKFAIVTIAHTALTLLFILLGLIYFEKNWQTLLYATLLAKALIFLTCLILLKFGNWIRYLPNKKTFKSIYKLSLPMIPYDLGGILNDFGDRLFLTELVGLKSVGYYSIAYSFGMAFLYVSQAFTRSWLPSFFEKISKDSLKDKISIVRTQYIYILAILIVGPLFYFVINMAFPLFINENYMEARIIIPWILAAYIIKSIRNIFFPFYIYYGKTHIASGHMFSGAILNLILNYFMIQWNGMVGAAQATLLTFLCVLILDFRYMALRMPKMPWLFWLKKFKT